MERKDVCLDLNGYPMNFKYQPDRERYGDEYCGYRNWNEEVLFYEFAVQNYDVSFSYKGKCYYLMQAPDHASVCDEHFTKEHIVFPSANALIETFEIDGMPLIRLIDRLENVDIH